MPYIKLQTSAKVSQDKEKDLLETLSQTVSEVIGKSEQYVMASLDQQPMLMSGSDEPAAFMDIRSIGGLYGEVNRKLSERLCAVVEDKLGVDQNRVYLNFTDMSSTNWGWNGNTFG